MAKRELPPFDPQSVCSDAEVEAYWKWLDSLPDKRTLDDLIAEGRKEQVVAEAASWPELPPQLSKPVKAELFEARAADLPWTAVREVREGWDDPKGAACSVEGCKGKVEGVQHCCYDGEPRWMCEEHALEQNEQDKSHA